jgi:Protein of unknown function (DUF3617)
MKNIMLGLVWLGAMSSATVLAAGSDELWEVSTKMEMPGMPFAMPAQTQKICMQKGHENDPNNAVPKNKEQDCKMSDVKISGNKSSWKMKCDGKEPMTGEGEITRGKDSYTGKMNMHTKDGDMTMAYSGKKVGSCDYATDSPQAKMTAMLQKNEAEQAKEQANECKAALQENRYKQFLKPDCSWAKDPASKKICAQTSCPDVRPQMCSKLSGDLESDDGYTNVAGDEYARKLAIECGLPFEKATRTYCGKQLKSKNYENLAKFCEKEARPLYEKNCVGRDYTTAMNGGFGPICSRFGKWNTGDSSNAEGTVSAGKTKAAGGKAAGEKDTGNDKDNAVNKVLDGAKSLKGLFGF